MYIHVRVYVHIVLHMYTCIYNHVNICMYVYTCMFYNYRHRMLRSCPAHFSAYSLWADKLLLWWILAGKKLLCCLYPSVCTVMSAHTYIYMCSMPTCCNMFLASLVDSTPFDVHGVRVYTPCTCTYSCVCLHWYVYS